MARKTRMRPSLETGWKRSRVSYPTPLASTASSPRPLSKSKSRRNQRSRKRPSCSPRGNATASRSARIMLRIWRRLALICLPSLRTSWSTSSRQIWSSSKKSRTTTAQLTTLLYPQTSPCPLSQRPSLLQVAQPTHSPTSPQATIKTAVNRAATSVPPTCTNPL